MLRGRFIHDIDLLCYKFDFSRILIQDFDPVFRSWSDNAIVWSYGELKNKESADLMRWITGGELRTYTAK